MKTRLKPTYQILIGDMWVLWYEVSNSYSIVSSEFKNLIDLYLQSETNKSFSQNLLTEDKTSDLQIILETIEDYLKNCNRPASIPSNDSYPIDLNKRSISKQYFIKDKTIQIHYDCELVLKTIHPALAHCAIEAHKHSEVNFDLYIKDEYLHLYTNGQLISRVPKRDYHLIQGKFIMELICTIHEKVETDWIGTFHGSTITDGNTSILFIGESGKGKSTLCAILESNGFNLLADDVSPMLSRTKHIYFNPSAISIKEGAFDLLERYISDFKGLPEIEFNKNKGLIKYLPCVSPKKSDYSCNTIILVNYKEKSETLLEKASIEILMKTLIPDSWLSPDPIHAKEFLDWLQTVNIYQLTYSDTKSVSKEISELFKNYKI